MSQKLSLIMGALCTTLLVPPALFAHQHAFDRALADDQQIIRMLERSGRIPLDASEATQQKALDAYFDEREKQHAHAHATPHPFSEKIHAHRQKVLKKMQLETANGVKGDVVLWRWKRLHTQMKFWRY